MKTAVSTPETRHQYRWAKASERRALYHALTRDRSTNQLKYKKRFVQGANTLRPAYLRFDPLEFHKESPLAPKTAFHEGLLIDEAGTFWIIKKYNPNAREDTTPRESRNSPRYERLAFLLANGRANYAEIRFFQADELATNGLGDGSLTDHYLTRVSTEGNVESSALPHPNQAEAFAAIFVANVFMRKWDQHLNNFTYVGSTPVCIDHDMMGPPTTFPHTAGGFWTYNLAFLSFKLITVLSFLRPAHAVDERARERLKYHFTRQNDREAWSVMQDMVHGLGLGAGLIKAEGLTPALLRQSIANFKGVDRIDLLAQQAGFQGRELENIVTYLTESQKHLGKDVGSVWRFLSGQDAHLHRQD